MWKKFKEKFIADGDFYRYYIMLAIPMIVQNAITSFVSFLDNIMVGQIGTEQMSGVAIVNQLMFVFNICVWGGTSGAGIFGTQYFGKGDHKGHMYTFRFKMYVMAFVGVVTSLLFYFCGGTLISLYLSDAGSIGNIDLALEYGKQYIQIMIIGLIPFAITNGYVSNIRETGETVIPMIASAVAVGVNLVLDYLLIFGIGPFPVMGVRGAAIATVIARIIETFVVVIWSHTHLDKNRYLKGAYRSGYIPKEIVWPVIIKGSPLMFNEFAWVVAMTMLVQCYATRGLEVVAAQNISSTITNLFNIVFLQLGGCISIVIGQLLGAGRIEEAKKKDTQMIFFSVLCCIGTALLMLSVGKLFPAMYNTEQEIKDLATKFIVICACVMPLNAFCHATYFTLRSGGKTGITFLFDSVYSWVVVVPAAFVLSRYTTLNIVTVFMLVQSIEIVKATIGYLMLRSGSWAQNIVAEDVK